MTLKRQKNGRWKTDFWWTFPDGHGERIRRTAPAVVRTERAAKRWEQGIVKSLIEGTYGRKEAKPEPVPTVEQWNGTWLERHKREAKLRPTTVTSYETILKEHVVPAVGKRRMDALGNAAFAELRAATAHREPKTTNNVLCVLSKMRRCWYEWREEEPPGVKVGLVKEDEKEAPFYPFEEYEQLAAGAKKEGPKTAAIVLLGGEAGLRMSEKRALCRTDLGESEGRRWIRVQRTTDDGTDEYMPKGRSSRTVPLTKRLARALDSLPVQLRDLHVFLDSEGGLLTRKMVRLHLNRAQRAAGLPETGDHILRHTFCSHLALRGVPLHVIKELAGHRSIKTTMRYAHLLPDSRDDAIRKLDEARRGQYSGNGKRRKKRSGS